MKRENGYDILLADALHSSDTAMRTSEISFEDILSSRSDDHRSCLASDFVVLVLSPPRRTVLSETVLVLDGCSNCSDADR